MAQYIKQGNIFGRIGSGIGQGLAEQIPKEVERNRLSSGLQALGEQKDLTPFQRFSQLSAIPGITPQMIQSGSELLRQEARGKALIDSQNQQQQLKPNPFETRSAAISSKSNSEVPSLTQSKVLEDVQEGYIPPTHDQILDEAGRMYKATPELFANDPAKALEAAETKALREEKIFQAKQAQHQNLSNIQDNVVKRLQAQSEKLNTQVPAELYSRIEDEAIQATKPVKAGGRGLTEQQAIKEYGDKLNNASRDFAKVDEIGNWGISLRPAKATLRSMKELQTKMEALGETDNFAKKLIGSNQLSPKLAYAIAQPVSRVASLNKFIGSLPSLERTETLAESAINPEIAIPKTLEIAPKLASLLKENDKASPLAIAYELEKRGYDSETWLQYVTDNADKLNLRQRQSEQAATPINISTPWNDWWLSSFSGLE